MTSSCDNWHTAATVLSHPHLLPSEELVVVAVVVVVVSVSTTPIHSAGVTLYDGCAGNIVAEDHTDARRPGFPVQAPSVYTTMASLGILTGFAAPPSPEDFFRPLDPDPEAFSAASASYAHRLVYGCPNPKAGAVRTLFEIVTDTRLNHRMDVVSGVKEEECATLLLCPLQS